MIHYALNSGEADIYQLVTELNMSAIATQASIYYASQVNYLRSCNYCTHARFV